jgi:hypothetical protein
MKKISYRGYRFPPEVIQQVASRFVLELGLAQSPA